MEFVTKKEFEAALEVIEKAIKSKQLGIMDSSLEARSIIESVGFFDAWHTEFSANRITFWAPDMAAKEELHFIRNQLKKEKENLNQKQSVIEALEKMEKKLISAIALSKV
jgi:hypothetical protein